jgi:signal transduction histidine kinase
MRQGVDLLLYGPSQVLDQTLAEITSQLSDNPQFGQLTARLLQPAARALQVQQTAILVDQGGKLIPIGMTHVEDIAPLASKTLSDVPNLLLRQMQPEHTLFQQCSWVYLAAPLRTQNKIIGALLTGGKIPPEFFNAKEVAFVRQVASTAAIAVENARLFDALREMSRDMLRIRTAERSQLSARLHDDPLQQAAAIAYNLERILTNQSVQLNHEVADAIHGQRDEIRSLAKALRDICAGLRPPILDQGLSLTLREIVQAFRKKLPEVEIDFVSRGYSPPILSSQEMDAVYHIVSEALNNAGKHAQAKTLQVQLDCEPDKIQIAVLDDGCHATSNLSLPDLLRQHHFGIAGMYQWAEMVNGVLEISPRSPQGMQVILKLKVTV